MPPLSRPCPSRGIRADALASPSFPLPFSSLFPPSLPPPARPNTDPRCNRPPAAPSLLPHVLSSLNLPAWDYFLRDYPDKSFVDTILHVIQHGVSLGFAGPEHPQLCVNLKSAFEAPDAITTDINLMISNCRAHGPFSTPPLPSFWVSPLAPSHANAPASDDASITIPGRLATPSTTVSQTAKGPFSTSVLSTRLRPFKLLAQGPCLQNSISKTPSAKSHFVPRTGGSWVTHGTTASTTTSLWYLGLIRHHTSLTSSQRHYIGLSPAIFPPTSSTTSTTSLPSSAPQLRCLQRSRPLIGSGPWVRPSASSFRRPKLSVRRHV